MGSFFRTIGLVTIVGVLGCTASRATAGEASADVSKAERSEAEVVRAARARYAGTWKVVAIETDGNRARPDGGPIVVTNHPDGSWSMTVDGREVSRGTSRIDPLASPPEIDIEITDGDGKGGKLLGIYDVADTTRRLCFRGADGWRPREFATTPGCKAILVDFERQ